MFELLRRREYQYTPLNGALRLHSNYSFRSIFIPTALLLITALTSFYAGRQSLAARTPQPPIHRTNPPFPHQPPTSPRFDQILTGPSPKSQHAPKSSATTAPSAPHPPTPPTPPGSLSSRPKAASSNTPPSPHSAQHGPSSTNCTVWFVLLPTPFPLPQKNSNHLTSQNRTASDKATGPSTPPPPPAPKSTSPKSP